MKPDYRRNQFGGMLGGPVVKDRTFFFVDYQGQRQSIARTVMSTVPTLLQRQGIFTEAIGGRVPAIYDPATTVGRRRTPFPGNTIPLERMDPVALALLQRYPMPTSAGMANNYSRTANEVDNQDQWDVAASIIGSPATRDQVFGRLSYFRDGFVPVTPLARRKWRDDRHARSAGHDRLVVCLELPAHAFRATLLNEVRVGDTRRTVGRTAAQLSTSAGSRSAFPGIPATAQFPDTLPTFLIAGYQQLGSPPIPRPISTRAFPRSPIRSPGSTEGTP